MEKLDLSVIILTYNEEKNIKTCLESVYGWTKEIFIVDSYSTDKTLEIAKEYTDKIFKDPFNTQAQQLNWALKNLPITGEWILRLDADERVSPELRYELLVKLPYMYKRISGLFVKRKVYFWNRWIKYGGYYPIWLLRIWRKGRAFCEERLMDEHIKIKEGEVVYLKNDIIDENKKGLHFWINKHNDFAFREAVEMLNIKYNFLKRNSEEGAFYDKSLENKRRIKEKVYSKQPLFLRAFLYFLYRYFIKKGFLDGKEGFVFHFLQGFWYRFLVDAKIYEIEKKMRKEKKSIKEVIKEFYDIEL